MSRELPDPDPVPDPTRPGTASAGGTRAPAGRTLAVARPATRAIIGASLLGSGALLANVGLMAAAAWLISRSAEHPGESALGVAIVGVQFFGLSRAFFRYGERLVGHDAAFRLLADLRVRVYTRLEELAPGGVAPFRRGDLLARMVQDVDGLQDLAVRVVPPFVVAALAGVATVALQTWLLPAAGLLTGVCLLAAATVVPWWAAVLTRRREARTAAARGALTTAVVDLLEGAPELAAFGALDTQLAEVGAADAELAALSARGADTAGLGAAATILLVGLACCGSLALGVGAVRSGRLPGAELAVVALVPLAAFDLVSGLPAAARAWEQVRRVAARVFAVLDADPPVADPAVPDPVPVPVEALRTRQLDAGYPGRPPAVAAVDLILEPGRPVALVGPSGGGKTTLASVLVRFLDPCAGTYELGGPGGTVAAPACAGDAVREAVGLATQDPWLFDATLAANLRLARPDATDDEMTAALVDVGLGPWFDRLPDGLATAVGPRGNRLSGGQRQRVALARVRLAGFDALVLDEPTEHLEPSAADALMGDLLADGRPTLVITHRLAGLEAAAEILVLEAGHVVERGTHHELLTADGPYAARWRGEQVAEVTAAPTAEVAAAPTAEEMPSPLADPTTVRSLVP